MIDFALTLDDTGQPQATLNNADTLLNAVLLSLHIKRGSFFLNPDFGSRLHELKSTSSPDVALAKQYALESLEWLITVKKITTLDIIVTPGRNGRLHFKITINTRNMVETIVEMTRKTGPSPVGHTLTITAKEVI
jgi:phage gp46-like protein